MKHLPITLLTAFLTVICCSPQEESGPGPVPEFSVEKTLVETDRKACDLTLAVDAGCEWKILAPSCPTWLTVSQTPSSVSLSMTANGDTHDRTFSFLLIPSDPRLESIKVDVCQSGPPANAKRDEIIYALAEKHLGWRANARIKMLYPGGLKSAAADLDRFLKIDKYRAYTPALRRLAMNTDYVYDPNFTQGNGGDCVRGIVFADYYLSNLNRFTLLDDELYFYHSLLVNMVMDLHDPALPVMMPLSVERTVKEAEFEGLSWDGILRRLETWTAEEEAARCQAPFTEWAREICRADVDPEEAVRAAGYRLAWLLNKYYPE